MANDEALPTEETLRAGRGWLRWTIGVLAALVSLLLAAAVLIDTPLGHRMIAGYIGGLKPETGLRIGIGEITGSVYGEAQLQDVALFDPRGEFLRVPVAELDWRPLHWFTSGLDIRSAVIRKGRLTRFPHFNPRSSEAPLLPGFDIRVDRFAIDQLTVAKGVAGDERSVNFVASTIIRDGRVRLRAGGKLGGGDKMAALLLAEPDKDLFDVGFDYRAPAGGLLAGLTGAKKEWRVRIAGKGSWKRWDGRADLRLEGQPLAALKLSNRAGSYQLAGDLWPNGNLNGMVAQAAGKAVHLTLSGTVQEREFYGRLSLATAALRASAAGGVDLVHGGFNRVGLSLQLLDPKFFGDEVALEGARATGTVDGVFGRLSIKHSIEIAKANFGQTTLGGITQRGVARYDGSRWTTTLASNATTIIGTGLDLVDARLANSRLGGSLSYDGRNLRSDDLQLASPGLSAGLSLAGDTARHHFTVSGKASITGLALQGVGSADVSARFALAAGVGKPWSLAANVAGRLPRVDSAVLQRIVGNKIRFSGKLAAGSGQPHRFTSAKLLGDKLDLAFDCQLKEGEMRLSGAGRHIQYGHFSLVASHKGQKTSADLVLDNPYDPAGLSDVHLALVSIDSGFRLDTRGQSLLGPFDGRARLLLPEGIPAHIEIDRLTVWKTKVTGDLAIRDSLVSGKLDVTGGGLTGSVTLAGESGGGQRLATKLAAKEASFAGRTPVAIARANLSAKGLILRDHSSLEASIDAQGIGYGRMFVGRMKGTARLADGRGTVSVAVSGNRRSDFGLQLEAEAMPGQFTLAARGMLEGRALSMPRRATIERMDNGGWALRPAQFNYGEGYMVAEGELGGHGASHGKFGLSNMPLDLAGVVWPGAGIHGLASGNVEWTGPGNGPATGSLQLRVADFSRTGLTLTSQPIDLALNGELTDRQAQVKAVIKGSGQQLGRLSLNIGQLPVEGSLPDRLYRGSLSADFSFDGPASAIWRLAAVDAFDLTGPVSLRAHGTGRLAAPAIRGTIRGTGMRIQSALTGTDIRDVAASGTVTGSRLLLTGLLGKTAGGGQVSGSGTVDFPDLFKRGPKIDFRLAASKAAIIDRSDFGATVSGPIRILLDDGSGIIAGRLRIDKGRWQLGKANAHEDLPGIATREINLPPDRTPATRSKQAWRYLVDVSADGGLEVEGLGLESEWAAKFRLRGTTDEPRIGGEANLVRGEYIFAGTDFKLQRGKITFDENIAPDPRLDIAAESRVESLEVDIAIGGHASAPQISLRSTPALPEDEVLSRLLFGGGVTELSAVDALQLGAAITSLKSGGGMGPINRLRRAIGLDRLRIVAPDPSVNRGTAFSIGKRFGKRFHAEIVTDGRSYNATDLEFRLTSWLSLLGSVSSINRKKGSVEFRKDY